MIVLNYCYNGGGTMNSFKLFGMRRKLGILCPVEGPPERNGQAFLSCITGLWKEEKTGPNGCRKAQWAFRREEPEGVCGKHKENSCRSVQAGFSHLKKFK